MSYATLAEARAAGITTDRYGATLGSDVRVQALLDDASTYIDDATGWWFNARTKTLTFDGTGREVLWLPAPIISLTSVSFSGTAIDLTSVLRYGTVASGDSLRAARLARTGSPPGVWPKGRRNVVVVGSFGFTKADGSSPPPEIRDACLRLVVRNVQLIADATAQAERRAGATYREATDGHSAEVAGGMPGSAGSWRFGGITGDPEIDGTIARFRRPSRGAIP